MTRQGPIGRDPASKDLQPAPVTGERQPLLTPIDSPRPQQVIRPIDMPSTGRQPMLSPIDMPAPVVKQPQPMRSPIDVAPVVKQPQQVLRPIEAPVVVKQQPQPVLQPLPTPIKAPVMTR